MFDVLGTELRTERKTSTMLWVTTNLLLSNALQRKYWLEKNHTLAHWDSPNLANEVLPVGYFLRPNITPNALDNFSSCFRSFSVRILSWHWTALLDGSSVKAWKRKLINFRWVNLRFIWKFPDSYWTQIYRDRAVELQIDPRRRSPNTARLFFNWHVVFIPLSRF